MEDLTSSSEEHLARTSQLPDSEREPGVTKVNLEVEPVPHFASTMCGFFAKYNRDGSSTKMSRVCFPRTREEISPTSSWHWDKAGTAVSPTEFWTRNLPEWTDMNEPCLKDEGVCGLSDILEPLTDRLRKYFLSLIACQGIIRRADARKKILPPLLAEGLNYMIKWWEAEPGGGYSIGNGQVNTACDMEEGVCKTLDCMHDPQRVLEVMTPKVAQTLTRRFDGSPQPDKQNGMPIVTGKYVHTNSNGKEVMSTLSTDLEKQVNNQMTNGGGYVISRCVGTSICSTKQKTTEFRCVPNAQAILT